jgi:aryl-alcohol dehydrogenase-like predicted oxidoreductase
MSLLDTAAAYAAGENERLVGRALAGRRAEAVICTKFGWRLDDSGRPVGLDSSPDYVRQSCDASLRRLATDVIDLYIQHRVDPSTPIEDTIGALVRLQEQGKVRAIGLSEAAPATIARAHAVAPLAVVQTEYSLWSREAEQEILPLCQQLGIVFMAYSPLGRGFLAGAVRSQANLEEGDVRRGNPRFQEANLQHNLATLDHLAPILTRLGCTPSQLALAWILAQPWDILPIFSTRHVSHLVENLRAANMQLTDREVESIGSAFGTTSVWGERHPAEHMPTLGR